jgi:hypothetical protein
MVIFLPDHFMFFDRKLHRVIHHKNAIISQEYRNARVVTVVLRHLTVGEIRATFNVNIATFNGK